LFVIHSYSDDDSDDDVRMFGKGGKPKWTKQEVSGWLRWLFAMWLRSRCMARERLQDGMLRDALKKYGKDNWKRVADVFGDGRSDFQCQMRWQKVLNPTAVKGPWTKEARKARCCTSILMTCYE
jgi:hypothetical protein